MLKVILNIIKILKTKPTTVELTAQQSTTEKIFTLLRGLKIFSKGLRLYSSQFNMPTANYPFKLNTQDFAYSKILPYTLPGAVN